MFLNNIKKYNFNYRLLDRPIVVNLVGAALYYILVFSLSILIFYFTNEKYDWHNICAVGLVLSLFIPQPIAFWFLIFPFIVAISLYFPIAKLYGMPDLQAVVSLMGTTVSETREFLSLVPIKSYFLVFIPPMLAFLSWFLARRRKIQPLHNKYYVGFIVLYFIVLLHPLKLFGKIGQTIKDYSVVSNYGVASTWPSSTRIGEPQDYVLIVGESARRDYFEVYGYPLENNPFLNRSNATVVDGLTSGGVYTVQSLGNMLTMGEDWSPRYDRSIVDLAKSAGLQTIWITTNQPVLANKWNSSITAMAKRADRIKYLPPWSDDFKMVGPFSAILDEKPEKDSRLFVLHMRGSHYDACERIKGQKDVYKVNNKKHGYLACYATTIRNTDKFIEEIYDKLKEQYDRTGRKFSLIYFSDHGVKGDMKNGQIVLYAPPVEKATISSYEIPLIKIDDASAGHTKIKSTKSGLRFTEGLAKWMGIKNQDLEPYDLFDGVPDTGDYGLSKRIKLKKEAIDEPIDISHEIVKKE